MKRGSPRRAVDCHSLLPSPNRKSGGGMMSPTYPANSVIPFLFCKQTKFKPSSPLTHSRTIPNTHFSNTKMASFLLRPMLRPQILGLGLGLSLATLHTAHQRPLRLDSAPILSTDSYRGNVKTPVVQRGRLSPKAVRQFSSGSIIGLCAGLAVSTFSKSLALLIGLLVIGVQVILMSIVTPLWLNVTQVAAHYGINVIPYSLPQRYITSIDIRSAVQDNAAFKLSFGSTFTLAAFMQF
ncbi:hypothetical protein B0O99DRAFT_53631 [Bisporella sp. PMI_857]|nr:hypothetical protein B0O99DRAFT_53631 [Bisporella sp. PMI_857]